MDRNIAPTTLAVASTPRAPLCFKCRSRTNYRSRMPNATSGDCYDTFACSVCDYVSWTQVTEQ
jgi:hypothetical protein